MIINLTPHLVRFSLPSGEVEEIPSSGVARVDSAPGALSVVEGIPIPVQGAPIQGPVHGLPDPQDGVSYLVSGMVLGHPSVIGRADVFGPGTGPKDGAIRDSAGQVWAVTRLNAAPR